MIMNKTIPTKGIDVSRWQGTIDWNKVKAAGVDFAMIRTGYCGYAGTITQDPQFTANMKGAVTAGIDVGAYLYSYAKTASAAKAAAVELLELIASYQLTYPVALDIEDETNVAMSKAENTAICKAFLSTIAEAGYCPILYTFKSFAESSLTMSDLPYDLWLAHVGTYGAARSSTSYAGEYTMWQYSWQGAVNGISGDVDLNHGYKDYPAYIRKNGLNGFDRTEEDPATELPDRADKNAVVEDEARTYTVVKGDNLTSIAESFGVPLRCLIQANQTVARAGGFTRKLTSPNLIYVGEVLRIPAKP